MTKNDEMMTFFIEITYIITALRYTIFYKIYFVIKNISIKIYKINIKYTILRY